MATAVWCRGKSLNTILVLAGLICGWTALPAEPYTISISQETLPGQSVFVTCDLPLMGAGSSIQSVKLAPHNYPEWTVTFDLPPALTLTPTFYLRNDTASALGSTVGTTVIPTTQQIITPLGAEYPKVVTFEVPGTTSTASARITSRVAGFTPIPLDVTTTPVSGGTLFTTTVEIEHLRLGRLFQWTLDSINLPQDAPANLNPARTWWKFNQAFLYPPPAAAPQPPRVETFTFAPENFPSRTIRVLLPRDYDRDTARQYPVLYAQDGQNVFSPGGAFGSWDLDVTTSSLIRKGEIPEIIVVAVDNSSERFAEYTPEWGTVMGVNGRGREFLRMMRDELLPVVNGKYRTLTGPENTAHIGSSLGGLLGYTAANEFKDVFGTVAAMSPSTQVNTTEIMAEAAAAPSTRARLWIDSGNTGTSSDNYTLTIGVRDALVASGHRLGPDFFHMVGLGQQHNEAAWRTRAPEVLRWIYGPMLKADETTSEWALTSRAESPPSDMQIR
jgi:predicted alpha/beta superfamily hydrolase